MRVVKTWVVVLLVAITAACGGGGAKERGGMKTADAEKAFRAYLSAKGLKVENLDAAAAVDAMLGFYAERRATDVAEQGDELLFQWGVYGEGGARRFTYDITRQLVKEGAGEDADSAYWQLSLTLEYPATDAAAAIEPGDQWCPSPQELEGFRRFIAEHPATALARASSPVQRQLLFENAG